MTAILRSYLPIYQNITDHDLLTELYTLLTSKNFSLNDGIMQFISLIYTATTTPVTAPVQNKNATIRLENGSLNSHLMYQSNNNNNNSNNSNNNSSNESMLRAQAFQDILNQEQIDVSRFHQKKFHNEADQETALCSLLQGATGLTKKVIKRKLGEIAGDFSYRKIVSSLLRNLTMYEFFIFKQPIENIPCIIIEKYNLDLISVEIRGFTENADMIVSIESFLLSKNDFPILLPLFQTEKLSDQQALEIFYFVLSQCQRRDRIPLIYSGFTEEMIFNKLPLSKCHYLDAISSRLTNLFINGYSPEAILNLTQSCHFVLDFVKCLDSKINDPIVINNNHMSNRPY